MIQSKIRHARNGWQESVQKTYERPMIMVDYEYIANNQMISDEATGLSNTYLTPPSPA